MTELYVDIETFSTLDLRSASVYPYTEDPLFDILMAAFAYDDDEVDVLTDRSDILDLASDIRRGDRVKVAHNAGFERVCFSTFLGLPRGQYLHPGEGWVDTQALAAEWGYPQKLEFLAKALGVAEKDTAGTALINFFCKPNRKGQRNMPEDHPEKWAAFVEYCRQDVVTLREVRRALPEDFPTEAERQTWVADQIINDRGIAIDLPMARAAELAAEQNLQDDLAEMRALTGLDNPKSVQQLLPWLRGAGLRSMKDLRKETVEAKLNGLRDAQTEKAKVVRRVLELRQLTSLTASSKYTAALVGASTDGRLRGQFRFFGAHTGRWSGRGVQLQNLPRLSLDTEEDNRAHAPKPGPGTRAFLDKLELGCRVTPGQLKAGVRPLFHLNGVVVDYSAIEARVIAWLAGEEWAIEAFRAGRDIYVETAERMGGLTRSQGKVAVLALGYNGGVNSLRAMGYGGDKNKAATRNRETDTVNLTDEEIRPLVTAWRRANPNITKLWSELGAAFNGGGTAGRLHVEVEGDTRRLMLPSGRPISYHNVIVDEVFTVFDEEAGKRLRKVATRFEDPRGRPGGRVHTYGGRLSENATQAVARDLLAHALVQLEAEGLRVVGHVHDEILVEGTSDVDLVSEIMCATPGWAKGLPVGGAGFATERYRKD